MTATRRWGLEIGEILLEGTNLELGDQQSWRSNAQHNNRVNNTELKTSKFRWNQILIVLTRKKKRYLDMSYDRGVI